MKITVWREIQELTYREKEVIEIPDGLTSEEIEAQAHETALEFLEWGWYRTEEGDEDETD